MLQDIIFGAAWSVYHGSSEIMWTHLLEERIVFDACCVVLLISLNCEPCQYKELRSRPQLGRVGDASTECGDESLESRLAADTADVLSG